MKNIKYSYDNPHMMVKRNFTEKEKIVFYGIIKHPGINDNALSKIININPSTIATIRNKLKRKNYFNLIRIPFLQHCGFELLSTSYDRLYSPNLSESPSYILGNIHKRIPNVFFLLNAPDAWMALGFYQNYLNYKRINDIIRFNKYQYNLQEDTEKQILFPFGLTKILNFFDYSQIIKSFFELVIDSEDTEQDLLKIQTGRMSNQYDQITAINDSDILNDIFPLNINNLHTNELILNVEPGIKFTKAEREVFLALVQYPELSDFAISKKISISATSINNIRKKFESHSIIKQCVIPNLKLLGFELLTLTHLKFKSYGNLIAREKLINISRSKIPNIIYLASNNDEIILAAYKNFSEYQHINDEITRLYRDENILASEPRTLLFPLGESTAIKEHSYLPLVNQVLGRGKSIIASILEIIDKKLGETGKHMVIQHLESIDMMTDELTVSDIPKLIDIIREIIVPIFGNKSADEIISNIRKIGKTK